MKRHSKIMSKTVGLVAVAASVGLAAPALAGVGAGKLSGDIVAIPAASGAKPLGKFQFKPADTKAGKPWTGGTIASMKFNPDVGDPMKPGLATGDYVVISEAAGTPAGAVSAITYAAFHYDAGTKKCTVHAKPSAITGSGNCGGPGQTPCADEATDKCTYTTFQRVGSEFIGSSTATMAVSFRIRIATLPDASNCPTGTLVYGGTQLYPPGPPHTCASGVVVGSLGVTAGRPCTPGETAGAFTCP